MRLSRRTKIDHLTLALLIGAFLGCGCASMRENGILVPPDRTGLSDIPVQSNQHSILTVLWRVELIEPDGAPIDLHHHGAPAVSEDGQRVFIGSYSGNFYCLDSQTGRIVWRQVLGTPFDGSPTVSGGIVFAGSSGGQVLALRESDGTLLWRYKTTASVDGHPVVTGDQVIVATDSNMLVSLDSRTGEWRWSYKRDVPSGRFQVKGVSSPLVSSDHLWAGFSDGTLVQLAVQDGAVLTVRKLSGSGERFTDVDTDPILVNDMLLAAAFDRGIVAMDPSNLRERWTAPARGASSFEYRNGMLFFTTADSQVEALRLDSAKPIWRFEAKGGSLSRPVIARDWLLVSSGEHSLLVLDQLDGRLLQVFNPGKGSSAPPTVAGDRVYWVSNGQVLYAMGLLK